MTAGVAALALIHSGETPVPVAAVDPPGTARPLPPFDARPQSVPLDPPTGTPARPAASAPIRFIPPDLTVSASDIPRLAVAAYVNAARLADTSFPGCHVRWQAVAAIGYVESDHARSGGSARPHWDGVARPAILGPVLDGTGGTAPVPDTDGGALDGDRAWDRAVGPMQLIPSTWQAYRADGNHDGVADPQQIDDATFAAADYLCASGLDLRTTPGLRRAVFSYNHSAGYVRAVLTVDARYLGVSLASLGINGRHLRLPHEHSGAAALASPTPSATPSTAPSRTPGPTPAPTPSTTSSPSASPSPTSSAPEPADSPPPPFRPTGTATPMPIA